MEGASGKSFIGNFVSVITKEEVRIEGTLLHLDLEASLYILSNAHCYGTEGREKNKKSKVKACSRIDWPVLFYEKNIKDLELIFLPSDMLGSEFPSISRPHRHF